MRFTDLLLASAGATLALAAPSTDKRAAGKFLFTGANEAGGEFGEKNLPGKLDKDYTWPSTKSIDVRALPLITLPVLTLLDPCQHWHEHLPCWFLDGAHDSWWHHWCYR